MISLLTEITPFNYPMYSVFWGIYVLAEASNHKNLISRLMTNLVANVGPPKAHPNLDRTLYDTRRLLTRFSVLTLATTTTGPHFVEGYFRLWQKT